jgi:hypothetical protein
MPERRRFTRIQRRYAVEFRAAGRNRSAFTHNLSPTGLFVCSVYMPRPGTALSLWMTLPGGRKVLLGARVVRSYWVPARLTRFIPSGFCVTIQHGPEEYFRFLATLLRVAA